VVRYGYWIRKAVGRVYLFRFVQRNDRHGHNFLSPGYDSIRGHVKFRGLADLLKAEAPTHFLSLFLAFINFLAGPAIFF